MGAYRKAGRQPNILVIMVDQQRLDMLETYGHQVVRTPNLNRLAEEGARFDNATTVCAQCLPARTSLLTGQAPHYHGAIHNNLRCQREMPFLSKKLAEQFHHSVYIGKWHVPEDPYQVGFTTYISEGLGEGEPYRQYLESRGVSFTQKDYQELYNSIDLWTNERCETPFPFDFEDHWDVFKFRQTEQFLLSVPEDEPFFACVSFLGPHPPWSIPEEYHYMYTPEQVQLPPNFYDDFHKKPKAIFTQWGYRSGYALSEAAWKEGTAVYWGYITMIDDLIGRLLDILDDRGLTEDTIVVYFSDHGEMIGAHRLWGKHDVLYEEVMRIPLIIRYPALITANQKVSMPVSIVDIFPTLLELCGVAVSEQQIAGRSFVSSIAPLERRPASARWFHEEFGEVQFAEVYLMDHHWVQIKPSGLTAKHLAQTEFVKAVRSKRWKYMFYHYDPCDELYDIERDPYELCNLADNPAYAGVKKELRRLILTWMRETGDYMCGEPWFDAAWNDSLDT